MTIHITAATLLAALALTQPLAASATHPIQDSYRAQARLDNPAFKDFSATAGQKLYTTQGAEWSCASCHTDSPLAAGKHAKTNQAILPLAPAANPARFSDAAKVEKWFKRNCNDVLKRACSAQEKGDFMAYVLSIK